MTVTKQKEILLMDDLEDHFSDKLRKTVLDLIDVCHRFNLPNDRIPQLVITGLLREVVAAGIVLGMDEKEFTVVCRRAWSFMGEEIKLEWEDEN